MASWPLVTEKGRGYFIVDSDNAHCVFGVPTLSAIRDQLITLQFRFIAL